MTWLKSLFFWKREKVAEELAIDKQFKDQLREAFLRQDDLQAAVHNMRRIRERYRSTLHSRPTG